MKTATLASRAALASCAAALAACGGSSGGGGPVPAATGGPLYTSAASATRGTLQLALDAVNIDEFYARFLRPGVGTVLTRPGPASKPVCHHSASPATSPATASSSTGSIETVVYYPAGDANCSQSPTRILVWAYGGGAGAAPVANGYQLSYAPPGDPTSRPGVLAEFEQFTAVLYDTGDGHTSLDLSDAQQTGAEAASEPAFPQTPPAPGPFPATFPINLPAPSPGNVGTYFAADEAGPAASQAGIRYGGTFTNPYANLQSIVLGTTDVFAVRSSRPDAAGRVTLSWTGTQPYYSLDPAADSPNQSVPFPLGQSNVTWPPTVLGVLGAQTSLLNFPALPSGTATYGADGSLIACAHTVTDGANGVSATATCGKGGREIDLVVTDVHRSAPATKPSTIVIDPFGIGAGAGTVGAGAIPTYQIVSDGSEDQIGAFSIARCLANDNVPCVSGS